MCGQNTFFLIRATLVIFQLLRKALTKLLNEFYYTLHNQTFTDSVPSTSVTWQTMNFSGWNNADEFYFGVDTSKMGGVDSVNGVNTDDVVHTARSSSARFPVFQCMLSAT